MNRRNFLTGLLALIPAVALARKKEEVVIVHKPVAKDPTLGAWMAGASSHRPSSEGIAFHEPAVMTYEEFQDIERTLKASCGKANGFKGYMRFRDPGIAVDSSGRVI